MLLPVLSASDSSKKRCSSPQRMIRVLRQPAQVHHRHRARVEERRREVAIRRRVHAVVDDAREAEVAGERVDVDVVARCPRSRRSRAAAHRTRRARAPSRAKSRRSGAACDRKKCATSTGCAGRKCVKDGISASPADAAWAASASTTRGDAALQQRDAAAQVQPQVERHLLVARAAGVQPAAGVAEPLDEQPLDEAVDVLVRARRRTPDRIGRARECRRAPLQSARASSRGSTPARAQRPRPREAAR